MSIIINVDTKKTSDKGSEIDTEAKLTKDRDISPINIPKSLSTKTNDLNKINYLKTNHLNNAGTFDNPGVMSTSSMENKNTNHNTNIKSKNASNTNSNNDFKSSNKHVHVLNNNRSIANISFESASGSMHSKKYNINSDGTINVVKEEEIIICSRGNSTPNRVRSCGEIDVINEIDLNGVQKDESLDNME